jgi:HSF-type DNA-binding
VHDFVLHGVEFSSHSLFLHAFFLQRYKSFQRQLNLWGFERKNDPIFKIKGTYSHPWFIRGRKDLIPLIVRVGGAGNKFKANLESSNNNNSKEEDEVDKKTTEAIEGEDKKQAEDGKAQDDAEEAAESLAAIHKSDSPANGTPSIPPKEDSRKKAAAKAEIKPAFSQAGMMPSHNMTMSGLYSDLLKKNPTASVASFLDTFQNRPSLALPGASALKSSKEDGNSLSSVISALNRAEAIGSLGTSSHGMDASRNSEAAGQSDDIFQRLQQQRASAASRAALIEEAMKISAERTGGNPSNDVARRAPVGNEELLQQFLNQQQQQQNSQAFAAAAIREIANQRAAQLSNGSGSMNNQLLQHLMAESGGGLNLAALNTALGNGSSNVGGNGMLLEKLRLEEGIQTLMRERLRLEAAAILEDRELRRLEYLAAMQM